MDFRGAELEPVHVMGLVVNNLTVGGGLESIMEVISDVLNSYGGVVSVRDGDNQMECWCC